VPAFALARFLKKRLSSPVGALTLSGPTDGDLIEAQAHNPRRNNTHT
jgi:hypothetical protein